jgi:hypothetical protein
VVGWSIDSSQTPALVTNALGMAIANRDPQPGVIVHSDHGVQFTSWAFTDWLFQGRLPLTPQVAKAPENQDGSFFIPCPPMSPRRRRACCSSIICHSLAVMVRRTGVPGALPNSGCAVSQPACGGLHTGEGSRHLRFRVRSPRPRSQIVCLLALMR